MEAARSRKFRAARNPRAETTRRLIPNIARPQAPRPQKSPLFRGGFALRPL